MTQTTCSSWQDAALVAALFAVDPAGLGGVVVRGGPGPAVDRWLQTARSLLAPKTPVRRIPLNIADDRLLGGLDLTASLTQGRPVAQAGILAETDGGVALLPMAERMTDAAAARLSSVLDRGEVLVERDGLTLRTPARLGLVLLDEGREPEERPPDALVERLAFRLDLGGLTVRDIATAGPDAATVAQARTMLSDVSPPSVAHVEAICTAAQLFGVASIRGPILALAAARAHAALFDRSSLSDDDVAVAARLVIGPRATTAPAQDEPAPPEETAEASEEPPEASPPEGGPPDDTDTDDGGDDGQLQTDMVIAAVQAALPDDLLARSVGAGATRSATPRTSGGGALAKSARRGRPVGSRSGDLRAGDRLNLVETLRAAAPWQGLRRGAGAPLGGRVAVRKDDFRIRRYVQRLEATTIFIVDASGSSAFQRLAEAKGAIELLLAEAYVSRTRVALVAFRGVGAELLLPPTRSLTRAKRRLADLPGGGGTPLAAGIDVALTVALAEKAKGRTPQLVFLTDGRANVRRDGAGGRAVAEDEALQSARLVRAAGLRAVFIDTSERVRPASDQFALAMGAVYAPLPYVNARAVAGLVQSPGGRHDRQA